MKSILLTLNIASWWFYGLGSAGLCLLSAFVGAVIVSDILENHR